MSLLESKVIQTQIEKEIFIDNISNMEIESINYPKKGFPFYEFMVGLDLMRIRENEFYGTEKRYFGIRTSVDFQSITVFEPNQQSIFAVKNKQEKQDAIELIEHVLIESPNFKHLVMAMINDIQQANIICEEEIKELKTKLELLERLLKIRYEDVQIAFLS
ncbi:hypothetical protein KW850_28550 [Bacillus sp. sid0103]|uniref:hypothetical protein n=1 Tax=Bacillus sp. sid0103 TaxID=2856337 RepID=UPI001C47A33D|nr:hypothetical protein [Bacillus sp. sid0103]MBV7509138.1 hypothetical protein [Bacillus sp. sid0103]